MNSLYHRLALDGIRRHKRLYYPFVGTSVFFIVLINLCISISADPILDGFFGATTIGTLMNLGAIILLIFALLTLLTNYKFIQKNKANESALYLTLGMEKKHLIKIYLFELTNLYLKSIAIGTIISLVIYKLALAAFMKLINIKVNVLESGIFPIIQPLLLTALIFLIIFLILLVVQVLNSKNFTPLSFMKESKAGQKEPKYPLITGIFGILSIGIGYYISLSTDNPMKAFKLFFIAVILVIIGTYAAFTVIVSGVLKLLKKNKNFYYKKSNFVAVSGLIYRVKNSANTLATIAILSTMVIIVLTSGFSLYFVSGEVQDRIYPTDYKMSFPQKEKDISKYEDFLVKKLDENNRKGEIFTYKSNYLPVNRQSNTITNVDIINADGFLENSDGIEFILDSKSTYDFGEYDAILLKNDEQNQGSQIEGIDLKVKEEKRENYPSPFSVYDMTMTKKDMMVFKDPQTYDRVMEILNPNKVPGYDPIWNMNFNLYGDYDPQLIKTLSYDFEKEFSNGWFSLYDGRENRAELMSIYGGIFFVGIILGLGFLVSTVLAIYYKQLSEGIEDKNRFKTMRQLGMTDKEAKRSISRQMAMVFFLPLIFAFLHSLFAIPIITKFLEIISLNNVKLYLLCLVWVFIAYIVFYLLTFKLTEKTYNKIVLEEK